MESTEAAVAFAALSQPSRLELLRLLLAAGPTGLPAGEIAARMAMPASTLSFHLSALERAGLTQATRQGRQIVHATRIFGLRRLLTWFTELCLGDAAEPLPPLPRELSIMTPAFNVLFLCTRNAARSIIAEAILNQIGHTRFHAYSAGSEPDEHPNPEVFEKLRLLGHDVSRLHSKSWDQFTGPDAPRMDFVIALCDTLDNQTCPDFGDTPVTGAWPMPDPAKFMGSAAERSTMLNELYASLRRRLEIFTSLKFSALDRMAMRARLDEIGSGRVGALLRAQER